VRPLKDRPPRASGRDDITAFISLDELLLGTTPSVCVGLCPPRGTQSTNPLKDALNRFVKVARAAVRDWRLRRD
jgi:hypothetical protein